MHMSHGEAQGTAIQHTNNRITQADASTFERHVACDPTHVPTLGMPSSSMCWLQNTLI
jgi:hypothetical protein